MSILTDKERKKKKGGHQLLRKPISVEDEFIGVSVAPRKLPKEKKSDITRDLEEFRKMPMSIDLIKRIIMRMEGHRNYSEKNRIKIYALQGYSNEFDDFIIKITIHKEFDHMYFLDSLSFYKIGPFCTKEMDKSMLKQILKHEIFIWLCENLDKVILVK